MTNLSHPTDTSPAAALREVAARLIAEARVLSAEADRLEAMASAAGAPPAIHPSEHGLKPLKWIAYELNKSPRTILRWCEACGAAHRVGGRWYVDRPTLIRHLRGRAGFADANAGFAE